MADVIYRNMHEAIPLEFQNLLDSGFLVPSRGGDPTLEVTARTIALTTPSERFYHLPHRRNNPFAAIAETLWVLAGRNDVEWLEFYLPRAKDFSDDGKVWRAGYGKRLRHWPHMEADPRGGVPILGEIDQLETTASQLRFDNETRRAVISLWDPTSDFNPTTKDTPCNDWIQFLCRDGALDMHLTVRSNDAVWGWSGVNAFEWSVLHDLMANEIGARTGHATTFIGSFHVYNHHRSRARAVAYQDKYADQMYSRGLRPVRPDLGLTAFLANDQLGRFFALEERIRRAPYHVGRSETGGLDTFLQQSLSALTFYHHWRFATPVAALRLLVNNLGLVGDFQRICLDWLEEHPSTVDETSNHASYPQRLPVSPASPTPGPSELDEGTDTTALLRSIAQTLVELQGAKEKVYGDSWKRYGEQSSIFPNIARKADRIAMGAGNTPDETAIDTYADLAVYCLLYIGWLDEQTTPDEPAKSFHDVANHLLEELGKYGSPYRNDSLDEWKSTIAHSFDQLHHILHDQMSGERATWERATCAREMARAALLAIRHIALADVGTYDRWADQWSSNHASDPSPALSGMQTADDA